MDWQSLFFGGMGQTPGDYAKDSQYQDRGQIQGLIQQGLNGVNNRQAPQAGGTSPYAGMQMQQAQQLQGIASGQQQGAGELGVQRQVQNALAGQQAMARMSRGGNAGLANLNAASNSAGIGLSGAGQAQQAALQDQTNAQGLLTNAMGQARGQDQQMQLANLDAQLRTMGMNDQQRLGYLQQLTGMDANQLAAQMQAYAAAQGNHGLAGPLISGGAQVAGAAMMGA